MLSSASGPSSSSFYQRGTIVEFLSFFSGLVTERTQPGERQSFTDVDKKDSEYIFHIYNRGGPEQIAAVMVADKEYPRGAVFSVITKSLETFSTKVFESSYAKLCDYKKSSTRRSSSCAKPSNPY